MISSGLCRFLHWNLNLKRPLNQPFWCHTGVIQKSYRSNTEVTTITSVLLLYDIFSSLTSAFAKMRTPLHALPPSPNDESGVGGQAWSGDIKCCAGQGRKR